MEEATSGEAGLGYIKKSEIQRESREKVIGLIEEVNVDSQ